mmetsp:Transcript_26149/g.60553  ORF Transcript_26149/g.60553 Transcript_26149/m.60553 type:complete len:229 (+) Transcript_26149:31-717(+)
MPHPRLCGATRDMALQCHMAEKSAGVLALSWRSSEPVNHRFAHAALADQLVQARGHLLEPHGRVCKVFHRLLTVRSAEFQDLQRGDRHIHQPQLQQAADELFHVKLSTSVDVQHAKQVRHVVNRDVVSQDRRQHADVTLLDFFQGDLAALVRIQLVEQLNQHRDGLDHFRLEPVLLLDLVQLGAPERGLDDGRRHQIHQGNSDRQQEHQEVSPQDRLGVHKWHVDRWR